MVYVPAGMFTMGDIRGDGYPNQRPAHRVSVSAFWLDKTEVTNGYFAKFVEARGASQGDWGSRASDRYTDHAVRVTWHDALAYCQ